MAGIYYLCLVPPGTGGDYVNADHVAALDRHGIQARAFYCAPDDGWTKFTVPVTRLGAVFGPDDIFVVGENQGFLLPQLRLHPSIKVLHNQNPFFTFQGVDSIAAVNEYPFAHILVPSDFCAAKLREMGVTHPITRIRPALPGYFAPGEKVLQIAYSPLKRQAESQFLAGYFSARVPEFAEVPWIALANVSRADCASAMAASAVYAAFPHLEGLGLMALEAMASGCHVVGYDGIGGREYATPDNGDWIADGDHAAFVEHLRAACLLFQRGGGNPKVMAGRATAAGFSQAVFESELLAGWSAVLGEKIALYRK